MVKVAGMRRERGSEKGVMGKRASNVIPLYPPLWQVLMKRIKHLLETGRGGMQDRHP